MITPEPSILERFRQVYEKQEHKRLLSFVREARTPLLLFAICMMIGIYFCYRSIILVTASIQKETELKKPAAQSDISSSTQKVKWYVDLSGAVMKPQTYEVEQGTRVFQLIERAGGLSPEADRPYIQRNYNFSVLLSDQQKIHIPSVYEVRDGYFTEKRKLVMLDTVSPDTTDQQGVAESSSLISINSDTMESLKSLPGVGDVTAQRIIAARPYGQVRDLVDRGIIKQSLYDKIVNNLDL
jgi:competence protein ComEA